MIVDRPLLVETFRVSLGLTDPPPPVVPCSECGGIGGVPTSVCCRQGEDECGGRGCSGPDQELEPCGRCETTGRELPLCSVCQVRTVRDGSAPCIPCRRAAMGPLPFILVVPEDDDLPF